MLFSLYQQSESDSPPLRIGLLLDSPELASCFAEVVDHILQCNFARLELLVFNEERGKAASPSPNGPVFRQVVHGLSNRQRRQSFLFDLYRHWNRRNVAPPVDPYALVDCSAKLKHVPSISVTPIGEGLAHRFPAGAIELIRQKELDVLIRFGFGILRGEILTAAKRGVWSYHKGDGDYYRGGSAHFWEVYEGNPISSVMLQVLTEDQYAAKVLCKGFFTTRQGISGVPNFLQPSWGASTFIIHKLRELHQRGWESIERSAVPPAPYLGKKKIYSAPSNSEMLRWLGPMIVRRSLRPRKRSPLIKHWRLAVRSGGPLIPDSGPVPDMSGFQWIESPKGHFYADPFLIQEGGKTWVFFEDLNYTTQLGRIACAEVRKNGISEPIVVLDHPPHHLSYPVVFRDGNETYMLPESKSKGAVELYRCVSFPEKWELVKELIRIPAADTTICMHDGLYWFFATLKEPRGSALQLWLFYASELTGDWTPHPCNPIFTDVRNSRGGGRIFRHNGKLFRPSQDCSRHYGYSCTLNEIEVLDRRHYQEKPSVTINPVWAPGLLATHTYSQAGDVEVVDGLVPFPADVVFDLHKPSVLDRVYAAIGTMPSIAEADFPF